MCLLLSFSLVPCGGAGCCPRPPLPWRWGGGTAPLLGLCPPVPAGAFRLRAGAGETHAALARLVLQAGRCGRVSVGRFQDAALPRAALLAEDRLAQLIGPNLGMIRDAFAPGRVSPPPEVPPGAADGARESVGWPPLAVAQSSSEAHHRHADTVRERWQQKAETDRAAQSGPERPRAAQSGPEKDSQAPQRSWAPRVPKWIKNIKN